LLSPTHDQPVRTLGLLGEIQILIEQLRGEFVRWHAGAGTEGYEAAAAGSSARWPDSFTLAPYSGKGAGQLAMSSAARTMLSVFSPWWVYTSPRDPACPN
jgi:hypothetical protein